MPAPFLAAPQYFTAYSHTAGFPPIGQFQQEVGGQPPLLTRISNQRNLLQDDQVSY